MRRFEFKLETVLTVRKDEEGAARRVLVEAEQERDAVQGQIDRLMVEQAETETTLSHRKSGQTRAMEIADLLAYLQHLVQETANRQDDLMRHNNIVAEKQRAVAEATKHKKMIENLREKQYRRWQAEIQKKETHALDEIATLRHNRGGS
jgi:flagellar FliJ protein